MHFTPGLAGLILAFATTAFTQGVTINNHCSFDVQQSTSNGGSISTIPAGGSASDAYDTSGAAGTIRLGTDVNSGNNAQVEYTVSGSTLFYDLSVINGNPIGRITVTPQGGNGGSCGTADTNNPSTVYENSGDDQATFSCNPVVDLVTDLCA